MTHDIDNSINTRVSREVTANDSPWFDSGSAAAYLGCSAGTLKTWRSMGKGPKYHVIHSKLVRYHLADLDAFVRGEVAR